MECNINSKVSFCSEQCKKSFWSDVNKRSYASGKNYVAGGTTRWFLKDIETIESCLLDIK